MLEALRIFAGLQTSGAAQEEHALIESLKAAFADAVDAVADPALEHVPVDEILGDANLSSRCERISQREPAEAVVGRPSDTVYVAVVDGEGNGCSLIQSLYDGFGSGIAAPGTGIVVQNRASGFLMADGHPNRPAPRKRPLHTILPAMLSATAVSPAASGWSGATCNRRARRRSCAICSTATWRRRKPSTRRASGSTNNGGSRSRRLPPGTGRGAQGARS